MQALKFWLEDIASSLTWASAPRYILACALLSVLPGLAAAATANWLLRAEPALALQAGLMGYGASLLVLMLCYPKLAASYYRQLNPPAGYRSSHRRPWYANLLKITVGNVVVWEAYPSNSDEPSTSLTQSWAGYNTGPVINPTTGLPMVGDVPAGVDIGGTLYGELPPSAATDGSGTSWHD